MDYPYAYYNGYRCCNKNEEKPVGPDADIPESQIEDGTCDGSDFNRKSLCCSGDNTTISSYAPYTYDNGAGMYFSDPLSYLFDTLIVELDI